MPFGMHWWRNRFRGCGWRMTIPRQAIIDLLSSTNKHLSAEDIYLAVHKKYPSIGLTTVYRTLELLEQMGVIHKFDFGDGRNRYELAENFNKTHHHHLVCTNCGKVIDYNDFAEEETQLVKKIESVLSKRYNFKITNHQIYFYGLCDKCSTEK